MLEDRPEACLALRQHVLRQFFGGDVADGADDADDPRIVDWFAVDTRVLHPVLSESQTQDQVVGAPLGEGLGDGGFQVRQILRVDNGGTDRVIH